MEQIIEKLENIEKRLDKIEEHINYTNDKVDEIHEHVPYVEWMEKLSNDILQLSKIKALCNWLGVSKNLIQN